MKTKTIIKIYDALEWPLLATFFYVIFSGRNITEIALALIWAKVCLIELKMEANNETV